jgi:hypothetical protein
LLYFTDGCQKKQIFAYFFETISVCVDFLAILYKGGIRKSRYFYFVVYSMAQKYWFTPKTYGRWFVPISWEWWVFTLFLLVMVGVAMVRNGLWLPGFPLEYDVNALQMVSFVFDITLIIFALSWFMEKKCDGEVKWRRWKPMVNGKWWMINDRKIINRKS